jgi:hypothetical protein
MEDSSLLKATYLIIEDFNNKMRLFSEGKKLELLLIQNKVVDFFYNNPELKKINDAFSSLHQIVFCSLIFLGQAERLLKAYSNNEEDKARLKALVDQLNPVESFYRGIGGIIGYHAKTLKLILEKAEKEKENNSKITFKRAFGLDLSLDKKLVDSAIIESLKKQEMMAEVYPIGGAGDRLGLISEEGNPLPAAKLPFLNRTLLEGLIRDLQAREYLYFKLFSKQLITPIALMTSYEKDNYRFIQRICEDNKWFGRGSENFKIFIQPLVPVITTDGFWKLKNPFDVVFKPGGHGMIWKLAEEEKVFDWLRKKGRRKGLIRQINNPLAGIDNGILAFCGWGLKKDKGFGFLSCERLVGSAEGVLVLSEEEKNQEFHYHITNLEYTDFERFGFKDISMSKDNNFSYYPSNTNILFFDIDKIEKAIPKAPIPGLLVNIKNEQEFDPIDATFKEKGCARLESTMQNIADSMLNTFDFKLQDEETEEKLDTFVVYNERAKTISVTKRSFVKDKSHLETPHSAYYDLNLANLKLLKDRCRFNGVVQLEIDDYLENGPNQIFCYHPALGPLYSIIEKKIRGGFFKKNAEMQLDVAEVDIEDLSLEGSIVVEALSPMGHLDKDTLIYSHNGAKVELINVSVKNKGRAKEQKNAVWKNNPDRIECLKITLIGNAEFFAENIEFVGSFDIVVQNGTRAIAKKEGDKINIIYESINNPSWYWKYDIIDNQIIIKKIKNE